MASRYTTAICLLRNDLRYRDNEVLSWACNNADHVLPVYCFDPRHYQGTYHFKFPKTDGFRLKFLLQSVHDLRKNLKALGSNLIVRQDEPESVVQSLVEQIGGEKSWLVYQKEVTKEETDVEDKLKSLSGIQVKEIWGSTLYHKDDLKIQVSSLPDVFTQFRKQVEQFCRVRPLIDMPKMMKPIPPEITEEGKIPDLKEFAVENKQDDSRSVFPFAGGESSAIDRLQYYLWSSNKIQTYVDTRNGMIGKDFSTKFSPWLANGTLSPKTIYWEIKEYEKQRIANKSTYWVIFELLWRDYFKFVALKFGNRLFYQSGLKGKYVEWKQDMELFNKWKEGKTGVPYIDANMRELAATGFMSNRGRQNVASFLTKDLKLDWRLGAEWFESQLLDHDVCSNYGNWLYSAGLGNDPREDRKFNVIKQGKDYDPDGDYIRLWIPELSGIKGENAHFPWINNSKALQGIYPDPVVIAPEWNRHTSAGSYQQHNRRSNHPGSRRPRSGHNIQQQRGLGYYFSGQNAKY